MGRLPKQLFSDRLRPFMSNRAKRVVLMLALAVLPVQGIVGALATLTCHEGVGNHAAKVLDVNSGHDHGTHHHDRTDVTDNGTELDHSSCHPLTPVLPFVTLPGTAAEFPVWSPSTYTLPDLFIPDRPQRPPLA